MAATFAATPAASRDAVADAAAGGAAGTTTGGGGGRATTAGATAGATAAGDGEAAVTPRFSFVFESWTMISRTRSSWARRACLVGGGGTSPVVWITWTYWTRPWIAFETSTASLSDRGDPGGGGVCFPSSGAAAAVTSGAGGAGTGGGATTGAGGAGGGVFALVAAARPLVVVVASAVGVFFSRVVPVLSLKGGLFLFCPGRCPNWRSMVSRPAVRPWTVQCRFVESRMRSSMYPSPVL
mmetsp:Transcript_22884/g.73580  ORF Transcript_22884/g.73580 Transcript_22884/m.73580 type:complete len:239 (-) Transcript_22884:276-992(-)